MTSTTTTPLMTTAEVAAALRCSPKRVRQLVQAGELAPVRFVQRGVMRFRPEDVERLIAGEEPAP